MTFATWQIFSMCFLKLHSSPNVISRSTTSWHLSILALFTYTDNSLFIFFPRIINLNSPGSAFVSYNTRSCLGFDSLIFKILILTWWLLFFIHMWLMVTSDYFYFLGSVVIQTGCKNMIEIIYNLKGNILKHYLSQSWRWKIEHYYSLCNELT